MRFAARPPSTLAGWPDPPLWAGQAAQFSWPGKLGSLLRQIELAAIDPLPSCCLAGKEVMMSLEAEALAGSPAVGDPAALTVWAGRGAPHVNPRSSTSWSRAMSI